MTRIVADTTCGLSRHEADELGIPLIPQIINFGEESYREGVEIDHATFMARLRAGPLLPKTAAPYPGDMIAAFEKLLKEDDSIVCIHPSTDLSGTVRSAETARESFPGADIRIIDTRLIAGPLATLVLEGDRVAKSGASGAEVEAHVQEMMRRARIYFLVDTLEFLQRGGRIGGAAALIGSILQVKPILCLRDGRIESLEKERTKRRALARISELVLATAPRGDDAHLTVMHSEAAAEAEALAAQLSAGLGATDTIIMNMVPAIVTHVGPGVLAVGFFTAK